METKWMSRIIHRSAGVILGVLLLWFFGPAWLELGKGLVSNEDYSFGLLLPAVSLYITYITWPQIRQIAPHPSWWGLAVIGLGFVVFILGELMGIFYFPPAAAIVVLIGLILLLFGGKMLGQLWFPLFLLFFMIPLPALIIKQLTLPLQLISSYLAAGMLRLLGVPLILKGNIIDLGVRQLQVVDACSGLRYVFSLTSLTFIYCYFYQHKPWKILVLLLATIPAAILANALRVAAMGLFPALQVGFLHEFSGWLIFVFCFIILFLTNSLLNYVSLPAPKASEASLAKAVTASGSPPRGPLYNRYLIGALILVIIMLPLAQRVAQAPEVPLLQSFDKFPLRFGPWQGQRSYIDAAMQWAVGANNYLEASYSNDASTPVSLWIAYYGRQNKEIRASIHSPSTCLRAGGWKILESRIVDIGPAQPVNYLLIEQGSMKQLVYYWFFQRGRWLVNEFSIRMFMGLDGFVRHRNDGALIRLVTPAVPNVDSANKRLVAFAQHIVPELPLFIPQ